MTRLSMKDRKIQMEGLEKNQGWEFIKKILEKELRELKPIIFSAIEDGCYNNPDRAIAELHTINLAKQKYEVIQNVLLIPERIKALKITDESKMEKKIRDSL